MTISREAAQALKHVILVLIAFLLQVSVAPRLAIGGVQPDFLIVALFVFGIRHGALANLWFGFALGLVQDIYATTSVLGAFALAKTAMAYFAGLLDERLVLTALPTRVLMLGLACPLHDVLWAWSMHYRGDALGQFMLYGSLPSTMYTMLAGILFMGLRPGRRTEA